MTVMRVNDEGSAVESTEQATCERCGVEGLRGDWPGEGVPDEHGHLICDDCTEGE